MGRIERVAVLVGLVLLTAGVGFIYWPLACIAAGVALIALGVVK